MFNKIIFISLTVILSLFIISCSDDDNPTAPEKKEVRELSAKEIIIPTALQQSNDLHAQMCSAYIGMANSFRVYNAFSQPPASSNLSKEFSINDDWVHTWTDGQLTITMNYFETDSEFGWELYLNGTDGIDTYPNWLAMKAEQKIDESYGTLIVYQPVTDKIQFEWAWTQTQTGLYTFTLLFYGDDGISDGKIEVISNPDDSGELTYYNYVNGSYFKESKTTWTEAGTGHWEEYDSDGNITDEGDF